VSPDQILREAGRRISGGANPGPLVAALSPAGRMALYRATRPERDAFGMREARVLGRLGVLEEGEESLWEWPEPQKVRDALARIMTTRRFPETCEDSGAAGPGGAVGHIFGPGVEGMLRHLQGVGVKTAQKIIAFAEQAGPIVWEAAP
jgi:hypothetical protein